ncbi:hypothetical protein GNF76_09855 [Pseudomonas sp. CCM 7893]|uniref:Uncharacterized protein n=1 Tax=Pseudomonas spelaei TaxID=1055469 RepID=A0A6I3W9I9_9PSED|nr:hypothetical protein [Pseudomonas spelaei]MUF04641.1 hypothetical protein [Pseudomonas spelaei]
MRSEIINHAVEQDAFFPSAYSLIQFTASKTDSAGANFPKPYTGKVSVIATADGAITGLLMPLATDAYAQSVGSTCHETAIL